MPDNPTHISSFSLAPWGREDRVRGSTVFHPPFNSLPSREGKLSSLGVVFFTSPKMLYLVEGEEHLQQR
jgi:hypothetical protein